MKKISLIFLVIAVISMPAVFAAGSTFYETGDQIFTFRAGIDLPAFFWFPNDTSNSNFLAGSTAMHTKLGGIGSIDYMYFISQRLAVGGKVGYVFNSADSGSLLTTIPLMPKLSWYPVQTGKFDLVFDFGVGISFTRYSDGFYVAPAASIEINPVFYFNDNWGVGISGEFLAFSEIYWNEKKQDTSIGALVPIKITCSYRH